jgi:hypothetical protein
LKAEAQGFSVWRGGWSVTGKKMLKVGCQRRLYAGQLRKLQVKDFEMFKTKSPIDQIRAGILLHFIKIGYSKDRKPVGFHFKGDGLRFLTDEDTIVNDWTLRQVQEALQDLEASGRVRVLPNAPHRSDYHVTAYPLKEVYPLKSEISPSRPQWYKLSSEEVTRLVKTDEQLCAHLVSTISEDLSNIYLSLYTSLGRTGIEIPDYEVFEDMEKELFWHTGLTERQVAICRMPDENDVPRLVRYFEQVRDLQARISQTHLLFEIKALDQAGISPIVFVDIDGRLWFVENGLPSDWFSTPFETMEALERAGHVTLRQDGRRFTVTNVTLGEEHAAAFQNLCYRFEVRSGKILRFSTGCPMYPGMPGL